MTLRYLSSCFAVVAYLGIVSGVNGQTLSPMPTSLTFRMTADSPILPPAQLIQLTSNGENVEFEYTGSSVFPNTGPRFVSVSPVRGKTPATLLVSIDPEIAPGLLGTSADSGYKLMMSFRVSGQPDTARLLEVQVIPSLPPRPVVSSVVSAAGRRGGAISPGGIITVVGANLCPLKDRSRLVEAIPGSRIFYYRTDSGGTQVMINGVAVPILYCEGGQVNAVVPFVVQAPSRAEIIVRHYNVDSTPVSVEVADTTPAILSVNQSGDGQGVIFNSDETLNSMSRPARAGETMRLFATGAGKLEPPAALAGYIDRVDTPQYKPTSAVSLTIGGKSAEIKSASTTLGFISSIIVIEAVRPEGLGRGPQPVVLKIGANTNSVQHITVAQ